MLHDVDLKAYRGKVTALVGDNGAGKSTLIKAIAGIYPVDSGEFLFEGKPVTSTGPSDAAALGIEVVYQDLALPTTSTSSRTCSSAASGTTGCSSTRCPWSSRPGTRWPGSRSAPLKSVRQQVASLSGGQRQTVAIAKAVLWESKLVILDEPTAALGVAQTRQVLDLVRRLADTGHAVVFISHNMVDVFEVADRVAALYLGRVAADVPISEVDRTRVVELITAGRSGDLGIAPAAAAEVGA